jgi:hypothetical protein
MLIGSQVLAFFLGCLPFDESVQPLGETARFLRNTTTNTCVVLTSQRKCLSMDLYNRLKKRLYFLKN